MTHLDIGEVARRSGVSPSALRFYEEKGLIRSIGRRGLRRVFQADVLERLALIAMGRAAGLSLDDMARMFGPDGRLRVDREVLVAKADELEKTIQKLRAVVKGLRHTAACRAPSHLECPTFRRLLRAAEQGALGFYGRAPTPTRAGNKREKTRRVGKGAARAKAS